jgi:hypothetical protein
MRRRKTLQFGISIYRRRFIYRQWSISFLCLFNRSRWAWQKRHNRVFHMCLMSKYLTVIRCWRHTTQFYDERNFNFSIVNFPYLCSNLGSSPAYGVYISLLIRYVRVCSTYDQVLIWGKWLIYSLVYTQHSPNSTVMIYFAGTNSH